MSEVKKITAPFDKDVVKSLKAGDNVLSQAAVDLKVLIEQMREQVQNLV